jgi:hypothetical protein
MRWERKNYRPRMKGKKFKKGSRGNYRNAYKCRLHENEKLYECLQCKWHVLCRLCDVRCPYCQRPWYDHPILGRLTHGPYWSEQQIADTELPYYDNDEEAPQDDPK